MRSAAHIAILALLTMLAALAGAADRTALFGAVSGDVVQLQPDSLDALAFDSHGAVRTWEGIVTGIRGARQVHLVDTLRYEGHYGYVSRALLPRGPPSRVQFFNEVQYPETRKWMPFMVYDLRDHPMRVGRHRYRWVFQLRRYRYTDSDEALAILIDELAGLVGDALLPGEGKPLVLVYTQPNSHRRPHVQHTESLTARRLATVTEEQLIEHAGGQRLSVLHPGTAVGELVWAHEHEHLTPRQIAVYREIPERVPPVAGIITLEPQTPLSHVNLLAKNRGTPNLSAASLDDLPGAAALMGQLVRLDGELPGAVTLTPIDEPAALAWWEAHRPEPLQVPRPMDTGLSAVRFSDTSMQDLTVRHIGAKASGYAHLQRLLLAPYVRPGAAIGFGLYRRLATDSGAQVLIDALLRDRDELDAAEVSTRLAAIRAQLETATVPAEVIASLRALISDELGNTPRIRLRSSTNTEDLPTFNGAGLYTSRGFWTDRDDDELQARLLSVMSSLWLERAWWERELFGVDHGQVAMGVLINPAFVDEAANGVSITRRTAEGVEVWINAQPGEAAVTNPQAGELPESFVLLPDGRLDVLAQSNLGEVFLGPDDRLVPAHEGLAATLREQTTRVLDALVLERLAAGDVRPYALDVEFKLMRDERGATALLLKQARLLNLEPEGVTRHHVAASMVAADNGFGGYLREAPEAVLTLDHPCLVPPSGTVVLTWIERADDFYSVGVAGSEHCPSFAGRSAWLLPERFAVPH